METRFAIIGAGGIAQAWADAFARTELAALTAVVDVRPEAAQKLAAPAGARALGSHRELLDPELKVDAAIVSTPPHTHPDIVCELLEAGIDVICEKPLAVDSHSARRMARTAAAKGSILTMASKFRFVADVAKAKELLHSGVIGEPVLFENAFTSYVDMSQRWNSDPALSGGGVLIDNGTHSLDIARYFLGPICEINVMEGIRVQELPVEETVSIYLRSEGGVMGAIDLSWTINKQLDYFIKLHGSLGIITVGWGKSEYKVNGDEPVRFGDGYDKNAAFVGQLENFCRARRGEAELVVTPAAAVASVAAVEQAYAALARNTWVPIAPALSGAGAPAKVVNF